MPSIKEIVDQAVKEAHAELRERPNYNEREEYARSLREAPPGTLESMPPMTSTLDPFPRLEERPTQVDRSWATAGAGAAVKVLRVFATIWFALAGLLILVSAATIWYAEGFGRVQEIFSPFNVINFIAVMMTLAPGIGAKMLAERIESRRQVAPDRTTFS